jgi:3-deoxy-7-phosphoheptulonate synthase
MDAKLNDLDDRRIKNIRPLIPPQILYEDFPLSSSSSQTVAKARASSEAVISGADDRLLVIVGPCSIHDPIAAREYAQKLVKLAQSLDKNLVIIMRGKLSIFLIISLLREAAY